MSCAPATHVLAKYTVGIYIPTTGLLSGSLIQLFGEGVEYSSAYSLFVNWVVLSISSGEGRRV